MSFGCSVRSIAREAVMLVFKSVAELVDWLNVLEALDNDGLY